MRIPIIAGNWKMNTTVAEAAKLADLVQSPPLPPSVHTQECRRLKDDLEHSLGTNLPNELVLHGALTELDRVGQCLVVRIDGLLGPGAAGCVDLDSGRVIVAWITPEG